MLDLEPITDVTTRDMSCNISFHILPLEKFLQVGKHLGTSWVDTILRVMTLG